MPNQSTATPVASFSFEKFPVRAINRNGDIWFIAADVCAVLNIKNPSDAIKALDDDERARFNLGRSEITGGGGEANIINESGLYALILRSRKPEAKRFRKWVTSEVLPSIRKTGRYAVKDIPPWEDKKEQANLFEPDEFMRVRAIAGKYLTDVAAEAKGGNVTPSLEIPEDVLAGIVAMQMSKTNFSLNIDYDGTLRIQPRPDPYESLPAAIADPGNIGLKTETIWKMFNACVTTLERRSKNTENLIASRRTTK